jgi:poly(hydroxyalkanoate) granule-associated protein
LKKAAGRPGRKAAPRPAPRRSRNSATKHLRETWRQTLASLGSLQARLVRERETVTRAAEDAVQRALAALNIPSRHEVQELSRKVDELSRRIEAFRR